MTFDNIDYGDFSFMNVKELNAYSRFVISLFIVDANGLERYIRHRSQYALQGSGYTSDNYYYISGNTELSSIPNNLCHLVFDGYNTSLTNLSFANYAFNQLESIITGDSCFRNASIDVVFGGMPKLKLLVIGSNCFMYAKSFLIDGLPSLETVNIGSSSFDRVQSFRIIDCPQLSDLSIDNKCANSTNCTAFDLVNLDSLKNIKMKYYCFSRVSSLVLHGMLSFLLANLDLPELETIQLGYYCFGQCKNVTFESSHFPRNDDLDLPKLKKIDSQSLQNCKVTMKSDICINRMIIRSSKFSLQYYWIS